MNRSELEGLLRQWSDAKIALSECKGHDYASDHDVLANFKRMHAICKVWDIRPGERLGDVHLFYQVLKMDRMVNLLHGDRAPRNESLDDTLQDGSLYLDLLRAQLVEGL